MKNWLEKKKVKDEGKTYNVPNVVGNVVKSPESKSSDKVNYLKEKSIADKLKENFKKKELKKGGGIHIKPENKGKKK